MKLTALSLFSGIGALDLGLERAGIRTVGQVESNPFCRSVLEYHWPGVARHDDVRTAAEWWDSSTVVDVVSGGFPCQPFSTAGKLGGTRDERWGWPWMADVIRAVRPRYVVVENVATLVRSPDFTDAFAEVLSDLHQLGFDAEWSIVSACSLGAPHTRDRLFLVAYSNSIDGQEGLGLGSLRPGQVQARSYRKGPWRDHVNRAVASSRLDDRETDGLARRMVEAGGNAVVVDVAEYVGRLVTEHSYSSRPLATHGEGT